MKSLIGQPKTHWAGESLVLGSGVFRYWRMACCRESVLRQPFGVVLSVIKCVTVLTPTSALQMECGKATEDNR